MLSSKKELKVLSKIEKLAIMLRKIYIRIRRVKFKNTNINLS